MKLDDFGEELDSDGGLLPIHELVLDVTGRDVGLAGAAVPDHHDLKHVAFIVHHLFQPKIINLLTQQHPQFTTQTK